MKFESCVKNHKGKSLRFRLPLIPNRKRFKYYFNQNMEFIGINYKYKAPFKQYDNMLMVYNRNDIRAIFYLDSSSNRNQKYIKYCVDEMLQCKVTLSDREYNKIEDFLLSAQ